MVQGDMVQGLPTFLYPLDSFHINNLVADGPSLRQLLQKWLIIACRAR